MKLYFQEINTHIQANKYILINLFINISKILQILRQLTSFTYQWIVFSISQRFSEFQHLYLYQIMIIGIDISFYSYNLSSNNSYFSIDFFSWWNWIDIEIIILIVKEIFDFNNFLKLFREYMNHQAHIIMIINEIHFSINDTQSYMIIIKIKLLFAFLNLTKFLNTWIIYYIIYYTWNSEYISNFFYW